MFREYTNSLILQRESDAEKKRGMLSLSNLKQKSGGRTLRASNREDNDVGIKHQPHNFMISLRIRCHRDIRFAQCLVDNWVDACIADKFVAYLVIAELWIEL